MVGKSIVIRSPQPVNRVSVAAPEIADFVILSPQQIYVTGKAPGVTSLTLWGSDDRVQASYDVEVIGDMSRLKEQLYAVLPGEKDLQVVAAPDGVILSGTVSSMAHLSQAIMLAEAYAPNNKVINLLQVAGAHQVMLEVRVAEMSRELTKRLGFNFNVFAGGNNFGFSFLDGLTALDESEVGTKLLVSSAVNALFRISQGGVTWTQFIDALKEDNLIKILAEPTLIALSGQSASFLAGGEFPVPVPQGLGTVGIEYKSFGVGLTFTPTVLSEERINLKVAPEVSELDFSTAVFIQGFAVPGLSSRRASTVVELGDGQSFAIAGLLRETVNEHISRFPILGEIPILGPLFRSSSFQKNETELIIIVTPHLVKPLDMAKQPLPTDQFIEPSDTDFFLKGLLQGRRASSLPGGLPSSPDRKGGLEGEFGHAVP